MEIAYKRVILPIVVPEGDYCWDFLGICPFFENPYAQAVCRLGVGILKDTGFPVHKPKECLALKEIE